MVQSVDLGFWGLGFRFRVWGSGLGFRVQGLLSTFDRAPIARGREPLCEGCLLW